MPRVEAVWVVTSKKRPAYGHEEILGCFVKKKDCHKYLKQWLPRRRWKYPEDSLTIYRFPQGFRKDWRTIETPYDIVTHEFLYWDPEGRTAKEPKNRGIWKIRDKPITTLGAVRDDG